ncbi:MAG: DUF2247 family protein [Lachnospiraceae bacterium]|nr:DUF2247 family protein [Lachnospiraceae bacterium]
MIKYAIDFERLCEIMPNWKWLELKIGLEKTIITSKDIKEYAIQVLNESIDKYDVVLELSIANKEEVLTILDKLCVLEEQEEEKILKKWIFAVIYYVYTYDRDRVFEIIQETYSAFEYPTQIQNLIPYMPCEDGRTIQERLEEFMRDGEEMYLK